MSPAPRPGSHDALDALYWNRVRALARKLGSDGCTGVPEFYRDACLEHDVHYRTHRTVYGHGILKAEADRRFRQRIQEQSPLGRFCPLSWWRWLAVVLFGKNAWNALPLP